MITHAASRKHYYTVLLDRSPLGWFFLFGRNKTTDSNRSNAARTSAARDGGAPRSELVISMIAGGNHTEIY